MREREREEELREKCDSIDCVRGREKIREENKRLQYVFGFVLVFIHWW